MTYGTASSGQRYYAESDESRRTAVVERLPDCRHCLARQGEREAAIRGRGLRQRSDVLAGKHGRWAEKSIEVVPMSVSALCRTVKHSEKLGP